MATDHPGDRQYDTLERQLCILMDISDSSRLTRDRSREYEDLYAKYSAATYRGTFFVVREEGGLRTNYKRATTDVDLDDIEKLQLPFNECNKKPELPRHDCPRSVESKKGAYKRGRSLSPQGHNVHLAIEYERSAMSGKSPGYKKRRHVTSGEEPATHEDLADDPASSQTLAVDIEDSEPSFENDILIESSKRVKPNTGQKLKQHSSEIDALNSAQGIPNGYTNGNARDQKYSYDRKDAPGKGRISWGAADRYKSSQNSLPDYGASTGYAPEVVKSGGAGKMPSFAGGPKPINRLKDPKTSTAPQLPKAFDLHEDHARRADIPNKRQKTGGASMMRKESNDVIDLELESPRSNNPRDSSSARSGQSQTQNGHLRSSKLRSGSSVTEYQNVESMMSPSPGHGRRRTRQGNNSSSSDGQTSNFDRSKRFRNPSGPPKTEIQHGDTTNGVDPSDPISDSDLEVVETQEIKNTSPRVEIPLIPLGKYQGSAFRQPPRPKLNDRANRDFITPLAGMEHKSQYFAQDQSGQKMQTSSSSDSAPELSLIRNRSRSVTQQGVSSGKKKMSIFTSNSHGESDVSIDELSADFDQIRSNHELADRLVTEHKRSKASPTTAKTGLPHHGYTQGDTSDDDGNSVNQNGDIKPTNFPASRKAKLNKKPGVQKYEVVQVITEGYKWLVGNQSSWTLLVDSATEVLSFEGNGRSLTFSINSINKIEYSEEDVIVVIYKSRDNSFGGATRVWLSLRDSDQSHHLARSIASCPTITLTLRPRDRLQKVFAKLGKTAEIAKKRPQLCAEAEDLKLAQARTEARHAKQLAQTKEKNQPIRGSRLIDSFDKDEGSSLETRRSARTRNAWSPSETFEVEESERQGKRRHIEASDFYGSPSKMAQSNGLAGTRSSTRIARREPPSQLLAKPRSPSPERWTATNPNWAKDWRSSIIYPREGKNKATVDKQDIPRLDEGEYLNDNLIIFYLRWLEHRLERDKPDLAKRVYFHNTFFYSRLAKPVKGKKGINYEAVERWTTKVDLLSYDYIIVPVNENAHWYVAIICNAPKLLITEPEVPDESQSQGKSPQPESAVGETLRDPSTASKLPLGAPPELDVEVPMKEMSLDDNTIVDKEDDEWPDADLIPEVANARTPKEQIAYGGNDGPDERDVDERATSELVMGSSDLAAAQAPKPAAPLKKGKRKSHTPTPRKYDPRDPRIITLDSLGLKHSPTCTNLKEYLIAEIKSKRGIDIPPPGSLGMTATHIPLQTNYCDCGLFLLSYIEQFLRQPDEFVHSILRSDLVDLVIEWPKASEMRNRIRDLLLDLQKEQVAEAEKVQRAKGKGKMLSKLDSKVKLAIAAKAEPQKASKIARTSVSPDRPVPATASTPELAKRVPALEQRVKPAQPERSTREATPERPTKLVQPERVVRNSTPERRIGPERARAVSIDLVGVGDDSRGSPTRQAGQSGNLTNLLSNMREFAMNSFRGHGKDASRSEPQRLGRSQSNAVEIPDSPPKDHSHNPHEPASQLSREESPLVSPNLEAQEPTWSSPRRREVTPYPRQRYESPSQEIPEEPLANANSKAPESQCVEMEDECSLLAEDSHVPDNLIDITGEKSPGDDEMLFRSRKLEEGHDKPPSVKMLSSPTVSPTGSSSAKGPRSLPSSPANTIRSPRQPQTVPGSARQRKNTVDIAKETEAPARAFLDGGDQAVIGLRGGRHTRFTD